MAQDITQQLARTRARLMEMGDLKAWSLVFTCIVDLCHGSDAPLPGPVLAAVTRPLGISDAARRTALHRLAKDGLVTAHRQGRISLHGLGAAGQEQTAPVHARIYAAHLSPPALHLVALPPQAVCPKDAVALGRGAALGEVDIPGAVCAPLDGQELPDWAMDAAMPPAMAARYRDLADVLAAEPYPVGDPIDRQALRTLILHVWRRLHLRQHPLAAHVFESTGAGRQTRARVALWLAALPRMSPREYG